MFVCQSSPQYIIRVGHNLDILPFQVRMGHTGRLINALTFLQMHQIKKINGENTTIQISLMRKLLNGF